MHGSVSTKDATGWVTHVLDSAKSFKLKLENFKLYKVYHGAGLSRVGLLLTWGRTGLKIFDHYVSLVNTPIEQI